MHYEDIVAMAVSAAAAIVSIAVLFTPLGLDVTGPTTYSMYVAGSKTFLLLGDVHGSKSGACGRHAPELYDWLMRLLKNARNTIDVYLEFYKGYDLVDEGFIQDTINPLAACAEPAGCGLPNARIHYVDVRKSTELEKYLQLTEDIILSKPGAKLPAIDDLVRELRSSQARTKTSKQIAMIEDKAIADAIMRFYDERQQELLVGDEPNDEKFLSLLGLEMDVYALGRMFKTTKDGKTAERIIVYAGSFHTGNYERFLGSLGTRVCGQDEIEGPDGPIRCVKLDPRVLEAFS